MVVALLSLVCFTLAVAAVVVVGLACLVVGWGGCLEVEVVVEEVAEEVVVGC